MSQKGFVRDKLTPDEYVAEWSDDPWYPAIAEAHDLLTHFIPGYQPVQIKSKFGGLRFYITFDAEVDDDRKLYSKLADAIILRAELMCDRIDAQLRERPVEPEEEEE